MSAKKSKNKGSNKKLIIAVLAIIAIFIILYIFSGRQNRDVEVETVLIGAAEDKTQVSGFIIRVGRRYVHEPKSISAAPAPTADATHASGVGSMIALTDTAASPIWTYAPSDNGRRAPLSVVTNTASVNIKVFLISVFFIFSQPFENIIR